MDESLSFLFVLDFLLVLDFLNVLEEDLSSIEDFVFHILSINNEVIILKFSLNDSYLLLFSA